MLVAHTPAMAGGTAVRQAPQTAEAVQAVMQVTAVPVPDKDQTAAWGQAAVVVAVAVEGTQTLPLAAAAVELGFLGKAQMV